MGAAAPRQHTIEYQSDEQSFDLEFVVDVEKFGLVQIRVVQIFEHDLGHFENLFLEDGRDVEFGQKRIMTFCGFSLDTMPWLDGHEHVFSLQLGQNVAFTNLGQVFAAFRTREEAASSKRNLI